MFPPSAHGHGCNHGKLTIPGPHTSQKKGHLPWNCEGKVYAQQQQEKLTLEKANQGMMMSAVADVFFHERKPIEWKKPILEELRLKIDGNWWKKKSTWIYVYILYLWRSWLDFPDRQEVHVFTVLIFQRWNSKKVNVSVVWFGEDTCSSWDSKHYKILQTQKKQGRWPMPHTNL